MGERQAAAYRAVRERTCDLARATPPVDLDRIAPATPEWRVRDVLAHLVGVPADALAGRLDGVATEPWTAAQVDVRRQVSIEALLAEWDELGPQFEAALVVMPDALASQAVFDAMTHEADVRQALGVPGGRDCDAVAVAFEFATRGRTAMGRPAIRVVSETGATISGVGDVQATIEASCFEFVRAIAGRRTAEEIAAYRSDGVLDPASLLAAPIFTMRSTSLHE